MGKGPGGKEVARVSVKVVPDSSKFAEELKRDLERIEKTLKITIPIKIDTKGLDEEIKRVQKKASGKDVKLDAELDGDGLVKKARRIKNLAQKAIGAIQVTLSLNVLKSIAKIRADLKIIEKGFRAYSIKVPLDLVGWARILAILGLISAAALGVQHVIGAIGGALQVVGGALATLPAIAISAAAGIGALAVGMHGFGDAMSNAGDPAKFAEALKKLSPEAAETAKALATFREPMADIRKATQDALFKDMAEPVKELKVLLPGVKTLLAGTASGINRMGKAWVLMATRGQSVKDLNTIAANNTKAWAAARTVLADFAHALKDIAVIGSEFLPSMGKGAAGLAKSFRDFIADARQTGDLRKWIQNAIDSMKQLGRIIANVWNTFANIRGAMSNGEGFLDILERLTQKMEDFTGSNEGTAFFKNLGTVMREVLDTAVDVFTQLAKTINSFLGPAMPFIREFIKQLGTFLVAALKALQGPMESFGHFLSDNKALMAPLAVALLALVTGFKVLSTISTGITNLANAMKGIKAAAGIMKTALLGVGGKGGLRGLIRGLFNVTRAIVTQTAIWIRRFVAVAVSAAENALRVTTVWAAQALKSASFTARYYGIMALNAIKNFVKMTVSATVNAIKVAAVWIAQSARMAATAIANVVRMAVAWAAQWIRMAVVALAQAVRMAAAWLIAMGPVGWIIAAVIALVALIVMNWDRIKNFTVKIWNAIWKWCSDRITDIVNLVKAIPGWLAGIGRWLVQKGKDLITGLWNGIKAAFRAVVNFFTSLASTIWGWISDIGSWLYNAGRDLIQGLIDGVTSMIRNAIDAVLGVSRSMKNNINTDLGVHSPSTVFRKIGVFVVQGLVNGIKATTPLAARASSDLGAAAVAAFNAGFAPGSGLVDSIKDSTPEAVASMEAMVSKVNNKADSTWKGTLEADFDSVADKVEAAMAGWSIEMDGQKVAKLSRKHDKSDARRR